MKLLKKLLPAIVTAVLAAGVAQAAVWQWSKTAATNATADPSINWAEGMSPSAVNDSARAMMARLAEYRDDVSGMIQTGGTGAAYTLTTNSAYPATPTVGTVIGFYASATNLLGATLRVDGGGIFPIQTSSGVAVSAGTIIANSPYRVLFCATCGAGSWLLVGVYGSPNQVPLGAVLDYTGTSAPNSNFAMANGQCISRTTYAAYFALVATTFGACDGSTTFGVPDLRGRLVAGTDMGGGVSGRITVAGGNFDGTIQGNVGGAQNQTLTTAQLPAHNHPFFDGGHTHGASDLGHVHGVNDVGHAHGISDPGHIHALTGYGNAADIVEGGGIGLFAGAAGTPNVSNSTTGISVNTGGTGVTIATGVANISVAVSGANSGIGNTGSGSSHPTMPPTMVLSKIVRIF